MHRCIVHIAGSRLHKHRSMIHLHSDDDASSSAISFHPHSSRSAMTSSPPQHSAKRVRSPSDQEEPSQGKKSAKQRRATAITDAASQNSVNGAQPPKDSRSKGSPSLSSWLSIPRLSPLPEPFFMASPIFDRDSIFLGYALPLSEPSITTVNSYIARLPHNHPDLPDVVAGRGRDAGESGGNARGAERKKIKPNHNMWAYKVSSTCRWQFFAYGCLPCWTVFAQKDGNIRYIGSRL